VKILITGANGSVGSDLVYFFSKFFLVYAIYRNPNSVNKSLKSKNIKWIKFDLSKKININIKPEVIIHCAVTHEFKEKKTIEEYVNSNILTTKNLIEFSSRKKNIKFFNFSTYAIYNRNLIDILSVTKTISEHLIKKSNLNFLNIRLPGVLSYINSDYRRPWINFLINQLKNNKKIKLFNKNNNFNMLIDTFEIFRFLIAQIKRKKIKNGIVDLQANKSMKLFKIINFIKKKTNSKSKVSYFNKKLKDKPHFKNLIHRKYKFKVASSEQIIERYIHLLHDK
jgi:nucleoside-diphosphate-sugar epimerase|tara:strand:- start:5639 stop:6481 length:843 start_codon:yes stop_codon:yes gene_type:complete